VVTVNILQPQFQFILSEKGSGSRLIALNNKATTAYVIPLLTVTAKLSD
jgi:6-phosphogluconolactonase (cycloisomerase 2 family)